MDAPRAGRGDKLRRGDDRQLRRGGQGRFGGDQERGERGNAVTRRTGADHALTQVVAARKIYLVCPGFPEILVIPHSILKTLVFALPLLICTFAVVLGVSTLTQAMQDDGGARVLRWISVGVLVLAVIDMLLLLGVLGLQALNDDDHHGSRDE